MAERKVQLESHFTRQLKQAGPSDFIDVAREQFAALADRFSPEAVEAVRAAMARHRIAADRLSGFPETRNTAYLRALVATDQNSPEAVAAWKAWFSREAGGDAQDLLTFARVLSDAGDRDEAARQLRLALDRTPPYAWFVRAEKLIARAAQPGACLRSARIAVLGNATTGFLIPILKALAFRDRIDAAFYEGNYGSQRQEVLDESGGLREFRPEIVILPASWRDLNSEPAAFLESQRTLWDRLSSRFNCHIIQFAVDYPRHEPYGSLASKLPAGRARLIEKLNRSLLDEAPNFVSILDTPAIQRETGSAWEDAQQWHAYQQHPAQSVLPALAEAIAAQVRAVLGLAKKVVVLDLDNTLWKGVIGEDGVAGIEAGPGTPAGEAHAQLQAYLLELKSRGVLLAVSSKNNPEDARQPFLEHSGMVLKLEDFAAFHANWDDKAANIRRIAADLSLSLDSFVFLDDNPLEREWVRSQIPDLTVVELGPSVFSYVADLDRGRYFEALSLSAEDVARAESYRAEAARETLKSSYQSVDDFLMQLELEASAEPVTPANLARVTQLINKTNQFNTTTRRYTEAQVKAFAADPGVWISAFQLADRLGSYGLIGALICRASAQREWEIDTWLMSCRTLGRQMEKFMLDRMIEEAQRRGIRSIVGVYRPTPKNKLVIALFDQMGFEKFSESSEETRYRYAVGSEPLLTATHVRNKSAARVEHATC